MREGIEWVQVGEREREREREGGGGERGGEGGSDWAVCCSCRLSISTTR